MMSHLNQKKRSGFLSRFIPGYNDSDEEEINLVEKKFIPEFFQDDQDKKEE